MHISHLHGEAQEMHCHIQTLLSILWTTHIIIAHTWWKLHLPPQSHVGSSYVVHPYHPVLRISLVKVTLFSLNLLSPSNSQQGTTWAQPRSNWCWAPQSSWILESAARRPAKCQGLHRDEMAPESKVLWWIGSSMILKDKWIYIYIFIVYRYTLI